MSEQIQAVRTIDMIEMEIRVLQDQTQRVVLGYAIETGRRLEEAKAMLEHGQWGDWVRKMGYSQSTANNLMRVFREYGASQQSLFGGEANSQALGNLSLTKAIRLLALPDQEEREKFVAEHDVENMSTRELEKALKERDEALRQAEEAEKEADDAMKEVEAARAEADSAEKARAKMAADMKVVKASLKDQKDNAARYKEEADGLRAELKELKDRPVEVAVETHEPTPEELEKLTARAVEEARIADRERIASMEKQLATADGDVAAFRVHYEAWQENFNKMAGYLAKISGREPERAAKLRMAVEAAVERMVLG